MPGSVWYTGQGDRRIIDPADWAGISLLGDRAEWSRTNGWSLPQDAFSEEQIEWFGSQTEFALSETSSYRPGGS